MRYTGPMQLNKRQLSVVWIGTAFFIAAAAYVPWLGEEVDNFRITRAMEYAWIFSPPYEAAYVDWIRLAIEWLAILVLTLVAALTASARQSAALTELRTPPAAEQPAMTDTDQTRTPSED